MRGRSPRIAGAVLAGGAVICRPEAAFAHGTERAFVLLLPTGYYLAGGALAVAASFTLLFFVPAGAFRTLVGFRRVWRLRPIGLSTLASCVSFLFFAFLIFAGLTGNRDPLENPLPLTIWTLWWVGLTLLHALLGNLWRALNPWSGPYRVLKRIVGARGGAYQPPLRLPPGLGYWPAIAGFLAFACFELIHVAPDDPERLALAAFSYWGVTFVAILVFGEEDWLERGEAFSVLFGFISRLSPFSITARDDTLTAVVAMPGARLADGRAVSLSGVLFILLTLSSVSFDGLKKTFWWLGLHGINPLEFPGRSAVVGINTTGLLAAWLALAGAYLAVVWLGWRLVGRRGELREILGRLVLSIVPISLGYHFAHYLTTLLVNGQYALVAANDPLGIGADLLGLSSFRVTTFFLTAHDPVRVIWNLQAAGIIAGHVLAVVIAHILSLEVYRDAKIATLCQVPLAVLMVLYTLFGLWLLATPAAG